jgi:hypothetical protein
VIGCQFVGRGGVLDPRCEGRQWYQRVVPWPLGLLGLVIAFIPSDPMQVMLGPVSRPLLGSLSDEGLTQVSVRLAPSVTHRRQDSCLAARGRRQITSDG